MIFRIRVTALALLCAYVLSGTEPAFANDAVQCADEGNHAKAIAACTRLIDSKALEGKWLVYAYYNRGVHFERLKHIDKAIEDYGSAIRLDPSYRNAYFNRALMFAKKEQYDKALLDYDAVLRLNPKDAKAFGLRGMTHFMLSDRAKATADFREGLSIDPNNKDIKYYLSVIGEKP